MTPSEKVRIVMQSDLDKLRLIAKVALVACKKPRFLRKIIEFSSQFSKYMQLPQALSHARFSML